jgi:hypothetical protein
MTTLTELEQLAKAAVIPFGQAMDGKRFTDAMVRVNRFQMEANPETILRLIELVREMAGALEYHQEQTRPISRTQEALAKYKER